MVKLNSPRLAALQAEWQAHGQAALDRFWQVLVDAGTPLIEPIPGEDEHRLATLFWKAGPGVERVAIFGGPGGSGPSYLRQWQGSELWYRTYKVPMDARCAYQFVENPAQIPDEPIEMAEMQQYAMSVLPAAVNDPLNPKETLMMEADPESPGRQDIFHSLFEVTAHATGLWSDKRDDVDSGEVTLHMLKTEIIGNERRIWAYTSPGYQKDSEYPLLVVLGGAVNVGRVVSLPTILDNLYADGMAPAFVAVVVGHGGDGMAGAIQESLCNPSLVRFISEELIPWVRTNFSAGQDPRLTTIAGSSFSGLAAVHAALELPEVFQNVIAGSGAYWWSPSGEEPEWLARRIAAAGVMPKRCFLSVGRFDTGLPIGRPDILVTNRHMRNVLVAKGSDVEYKEFNGGHIPLSGQIGIAEALIWLSGTRGADSALRA